MASNDVPAEQMKKVLKEIFELFRSEGFRNDLRILAPDEDKIDDVIHEAQGKIFEQNGIPAKKGIEEPVFHQSTNTNQDWVYCQKSECFIQLTQVCSGESYKLTVLLLEIPNLLVFVGRLSFAC
jgi:hypothetical protein